MEVNDEDEGQTDALSSCSVRYVSSVNTCILSVNMHHSMVNTFLGKMPKSKHSWLGEYSDYFRSIYTVCVCSTTEVYT